MALNFDYEKFDLLCKYYTSLITRSLHQYKNGYAYSMTYSITPTERSLFGVSRGSPIYIAIYDKATKIELHVGARGSDNRYDLSSARIVSIEAPEQQQMLLDKTYSSIEKNIKAQLFSNYTATDQYKAYRERTSSCMMARNLASLKKTIAK